MPACASLLGMEFQKITVGEPTQAANPSKTLAGNVEPVLVDGLVIGHIADLDSGTCNWVPENAGGFEILSMFCMGARNGKDELLKVIDTLVVRQAERLAAGLPLRDVDKDPLDPELRPWLSDGSFGQSLRHPLIYAIPYWPQQAPYYNARLRLMKAEVEKALAAQKWGSFVVLHERPYRLDALLRIVEHLSDTEYWQLVGQFWTDSENIRQNFKEWRALWSSQRPGREQAMDDEEQAFLAQLPETVTIYRGYQYAASRRGMSWTLDRDRAVWFARRFADHRKMQPKLATASVKRSNICAYFAGRGESEVIVLSRHLIDVSSRPA
jgi:hypothetical protein